MIKLKFTLTTSLWVKGDESKEGYAHSLNQLLR